MLGYPEIVLILALALLIIGPAKLPEMARALGNAMREFRKATSEFEAATRDLERKLPDLDNLDQHLPDLNTLGKELLTPTPSQERQAIRSKTIQESLKNEMAVPDLGVNPSNNTDKKVDELATVLGVDVEGKDEQRVKEEILDKVKALKKKEVE